MYGQSARCRKTQYPYSLEGISYRTCKVKITLCKSVRTVLVEVLCDICARRITRLRCRNRYQVVASSVVIPAGFVFYYKIDSSNCLCRIVERAKNHLPFPVHLPESCFHSFFRYGNGSFGPISCFRSIPGIYTPVQF